MLLSMTGYGRASGHFNGKTISVEIRTLNSRLTDLKMRLPGDYKEKEIEVRKLVTQHAERGKIDLLMDVQSDDGGALVTLNKGLFRGYHRELTRLAKELDIPQHDILQTIMRIPNVASTPSGEVDEEEWAAVCRIITEALDQLRAFRDQEGDALEADLQLRVSNIMGLLQKVEPHEKERFTRMRERLNNNMEEVFGKEKLDSNRFEQEILYYLEKMDITEEKVRLEQHCKYFIEQVNNKEISGGRTLNFISQEMGREINTLGAKAYDANIQRLVVQMKDELEKIKEQLANVL
ncbi:MAG: YicC/YloC family endoribonuclease [Saprospiraceae bacterium]